MKNILPLLYIFLLLAACSGINIPPVEAYTAMPPRSVTPTTVPTLAPIAMKDGDVKLFRNGTMDATITRTGDNYSVSTNNPELGFVDGSSIYWGTGFLVGTIVGENFFPAPGWLYTPPSIIAP